MCGVFEHDDRAVTLIVALLKRLKGEIGWVLAGQSLTFVGGVAGVKLLTNLLTAKEYGEFALAMTVVGTVNLFVFGPIAQAVLRFYSICRERSEVPDFIHTTLKFNYLASIAACALAIGVYLYGVAGFGVERWAELGALAILSGAISGVLSSPISIFSATRNRRAVALFQGSDVILRTICAVLLIVISGGSPRAAMLGYCIGGVVVVVLAVRALSAQLQMGLWPFLAASSSANARLEKDMVLFFLPFVAFALFAVVAQLGDRWLVQKFFGTQDVAVYALLLQLASIPSTLLYSVMSTLLAPIVFSRSASLERVSKGVATVTTIVFKASVIYVMCVIFGALVLAEWGDSLVEMASSQAYTGFKRVLIVLYFSAAVFQLGQFIALVGLARNRPQEFIVPKGAQAVLVIGLGFFAVPVWGIEGMAWSLLAGSVVHLFAIIYASFR